MPSIYADPDLDRMKSKSIAIPTLVPNAKALKDEDTSDNDQSNKIISELYGNVISIMDNDKKVVITSLKHKLNSGDIIIEEYII